MDNRKKLGTINSGASLLSAGSVQNWIGLTMLRIGIQKWKGLTGDSGLVLRYGKDPSGMD